MADDQYEPDRDRVQDRAEARQHERAKHVESIVDDAIGDLIHEHAFPTTGEELAADYGGDAMDLPNETEALGDALDRLASEQFETPEEAEEALYNELREPESKPYLPEEEMPQSGENLSDQPPEEGDLGEIPEADEREYRS